MHDPRVVAIGASAGGVEALSRIVAQLAPGFPLPIFVVLHLPEHAKSLLPMILSRAGRLPAAHPNDGDPIRPGTITIAPPDHHLVLEPGRVRVVRGPRMNLHRPSLDVLLRSAVHAYGDGVVGVVLTGTRTDGTAGLMRVKQAGGTTIVQAPSDAAYEGMPRSAIEALTPDHVVDLDEIPALLTRIAATARAPATAADARPAPAHGIAPVLDPDDALRAVRFGIDESGRGELTSLTCASCGGALWREGEGAAARFTCRTGHVFTAAMLGAAQVDAVEDALWAAARTLQETAALAQRLQSDAERSGHVNAARRFADRARTAEKHAAVVRDLVVTLPPALEDDGE